MLVTDILLGQLFCGPIGVARLRLGGARDYAMRIWLNRDAMASRGVTVQDIESVLRAENVELPAGNIKSADRDFAVRVVRAYKTAVTRFSPSGDKARQ